MPETLETGTYQPSNEIEVVYWKAPDKDGDGEEVWEDRYDHDGNSLGRETVKDGQGNPTYHYTPPDGFTNRPSFDHTDNYVKTDHRGRVLRDLNGSALGIRPGTALVLYPDGRSEVLKDEYSRHLFAKAHSKVSADVDLTDTNDDEDPADETPVAPAKKATPAKATPSTVAQGGSK